MANLDDCTTMNLHIDNKLKTQLAGGLAQGVKSPIFADHIVIPLQVMLPKHICHGFKRSGAGGETGDLVLTVVPGKCPKEVEELEALSPKDRHE